MERDQRFVEADRIKLEKEINEWKRWLDFYFRPKEWERRNDGEIYEAMGVKYAEKFFYPVIWFIKKFNLKKAASTYVVSETSEIGLKKYDKDSRFNEAAHALLTFSTTYFAIFFIREMLADPSGDLADLSFLLAMDGLFLRGFITFWKELKSESF